MRLKGGNSSIVLFIVSVLPFKQILGAMIYREYLRSIMSSLRSEGTKARRAVVPEYEFSAVWQILSRLAKFYFICQNETIYTNYFHL